MYREGFNNILVGQMHFEILVDFSIGQAKKEKKNKTVYPDTNKKYIKALNMPRNNSMHSQLQTDPLGSAHDARVSKNT